jgi:hypothetical protein
MRRFRRLPTAVRWALLGMLLVGLSGATATAAKRITGHDVANSSLTGKDLRNSSITGADIKNRSLDARDLRGSIRGPQGPTGPTGPPGPASLGTLRRVTGPETALPAATVDPNTGFVTPSTALAIADCPETPLMFAVSGGWELVQDGGAIPGPIADRDVVTGWAVALQNLSGGTATFRALVYCAEYGKAITVGPEGFAPSGPTVRRHSDAAREQLESMTRARSGSIVRIGQP